MTLYPPHLPLTSANICKVIEASPPVTQCFAVPYVIKLLAETPEGIKALANFDIVGFAGAALPVCSSTFHSEGKGLIKGV